MKHPRTVMSLLTTNCRTKPTSYLTFPLGGSQKDHMPQTGSAQGFRLLFSHYVLLFCNPMDSSPTRALSMGFPWQEYWSGLPFPSPGDLPGLGIEHASPAMAGGFFTI